MTNIEFKEVKQSFYAGNQNIDMISEIFEGETTGDTKIQIKGNTLLWISGEEIDDFKQDYIELIEKYAI